MGLLLGHRRSLPPDAVPLITLRQLEEKQGAHKRPLLFFVALILLPGLALFLPALDGGFVFDDYPNLLDNPAFQRPLDTFAAVWEAALSSPSSTLGRPLGFLSLAIDVALFGLNPYALKLTGLLMHGGNAFLLALLLYRLLAWPGLAQGTLARAPMIWATIIAMAWSILAIHVSTVVYVVQRLEILAHTFVFGSLILYLDGRRRLLDGQQGAWWRILTALIPLPAIGILAKETAALIPVYALALEGYALGMATARVADRTRLLAIFGALVVLGLLLVALLGPEVWHGDAWSLRDFGPGERLLTQTRVLWDYLIWILLPIPGDMGLYHDAYVVSRSWVDPWTTLPALLAWLTVIAGLLWRFGRPSLVLLGVALFLAGHLLTSSFLPLELVFEHRNYFASVGVLLIFAALLARLADAASLRLAVPLLAIFLVWQALATLARAHEWGDPIRFAVAEAERNPVSPRARYELGVVLLRRTGFDASSPAFGPAMKSFQEAAQLPGSSPLPEQALLIAASRAGSPIQEDWWDSLLLKAQTAQIDPQYVSALVSLANCASGGLCAFETGKVVSVLATAAARSGDPDVLLAYANYALAVLGDGDLVLRLAQDAVAADPQNPNRHYMLGQYQALLMDFDGARKSADEVRRWDRWGQHRTREQALRQLIATREQELLRQSD